jgi:hypothetical protein
MTMQQTAFERLDKWVLIGGVALLAVSILVLVVLQMFGKLSGKFKRQRKAKRESPEPPTPSAAFSRAEPGDLPEDLQRACAAMEVSLADLYLKLAESWLRTGEPRQSELTFQQVIQKFPGSGQAAIAQQRLGAIRVSSEAIKPTVSSKPL